MGENHAVIVGVGETPYTHGTSATSDQLVFEAIASACADAGLHPSELDGMVMPQIGASPSHAKCLECLPIEHLTFHAEVELGGAGPAAAIWLAAQAVAAGMANHIVVANGSAQYSDPRRYGNRAHQWRDPRGEIRQLLERPYGLARPIQWYSLHANRWLFETKADRGGLREVSLSTRAHANRNPRAYFHDATLSAEQYDNSPMIVEPFRLFDICLQSDGAAAVVVSSRGSAQKAGLHPIVEVVAGGQSSPRMPTGMWGRPDVTEMGITNAAKEAFGSTDLSLDDIDFVEIYDCFTFVALRQLEELGFCDRGDGPQFVSGGRIAPGGALPMNTHGGLLSEGHIAGMNHVVEAVRQLRGEAGPTQVEQARVGLVTGYGDFSEGSILLLRGDGK